MRMVPPLAIVGAGRIAAVGPGRRVQRTGPVGGYRLLGQRAAAYPWQATPRGTGSRVMTARQAAMDAGSDRCWAGQRKESK